MKNQIRRREFITLLGGARAPPLTIGRKIGPSVILAVVIQTLSCPLAFTDPFSAPVFCVTIK
jgi:hypothetical protein